MGDYVDEFEPAFSHCLSDLFSEADCSSLRLINAPHVIKWRKDSPVCIAWPVDINHLFASYGPISVLIAQLLLHPPKSLIGISPILQIVVVSMNEKNEMPRNL